MKRIIILLTGLVIGVATLTYVYFSKLSNESNAKDLALQSATNNAALLFSFQNDKSFYQIIEGQGLLQQVLGLEKTDLLRQLKALIIDDKSLNAFIKDQEVYISVLPDTNQTLNFLLTIQIQPEQSIQDFFSQIKSKSTPVNDLDNVYSVRLNDSLSLFVGLQNQVITASTSLKLVKDASIRLAENPFTDYIKANNMLNKNVLAHIYINFNQAPLLLKNIIAGNVNGEISIFNKQNSFATLNYNFSKEKILFNGYTELKNEDNYLKTFENTAPQSSTLNNILPDNTANYVLYAFDNYGNWAKKLRVWQENRKNEVYAQKVVTQVKTNYRVDLNQIFPLYSKNQFILFQLSTTEKLAAIALSDGEKVKQLLLDVSADYNEDIRLFKSSDILFTFYGEPFKKFGRPYYTIIDNTLVLANNASTIQAFLSDYRGNRLLIQNAEYQDALNQISSTSNVSYYIGTKNSTDIFRNNILSPYYKHLRANEGLKNFDTFYYQMSADKGKFITNLLLNKYLKPEIPDSLSNR